MRIFLVFCIVLVFSLPVMADELEDLNTKANQINLQILRLHGAATLNNDLLKQAARRGVEYDDTLLKLQENLKAVQAAAAKLQPVKE